MRDEHKNVQTELQSLWDDCTDIMENGSEELVEAKVLEFHARAEALRKKYPFLPPVPEITAPTIVN
jgi:hypothetical protein